MPRLTAADYYHAHRQLRHHWQTTPGLFAELSSAEQWQLHDYFQPSKNLSKEELLEHRAAITRRRPGLPQQAGRAYAKFQAQAAAWARQRELVKQPVPASGRSSRSRQRHITVKSVVRPEPDIQTLARALQQLAVDLRRQQQDGQQPDDHGRRASP